MPELPNKKIKSFAQEYVHNIADAKTLLRKELTVSHSEQSLLQQRIQVMEAFLGDLPASDPQYSMISTAIQMDQIELAELKAREVSLLQKIDEV